MKLVSLFALLVCLISFVGALPLPNSDDEGSTPPSTQDKGKGRAPASPPPSRPRTPTPATHPDVPLPARTGVHNDVENEIITAYYGDDLLPEHMRHLQRNQALHPGNREPMRRANSRERNNNRKEALFHIKPAGKDRKTLGERVRDEKHIAMLFNKDHSKTTTVEYLPEKESKIEGGLTSALAAALDKNPGSKGQIRPNPGWLTLNPHQRIGHEAPAALHAQTFRKMPAVQPAAKSPKPKPSEAEKAAEAEKEAAEAEKKAAGYTPTVNNMQLRPRLGKAPPPPPIVKGNKPPGAGKANAKPGTTYLVPGRVVPLGHVWQRNAAGASHAGVPALVRDSHTRQPTRPQDRDHYMRQQAEAHAHAQAALQRPATPAPHPHPGPPTGHSNEKKDVLQNNLAKFNAQHAPTAANALRGSSEAPGRMQTHTTPHAAPAILPPNHAAPVPAAHPHQPAPVPAAHPHQPAPVPAAHPHQPAPVPAAHPHQPAPVPAAHPHQPAPVPAAHPHQPAPGPSRPPPPKAGKKKTGKK